MQTRGAAMYQEERLDAILEHLHQHKRIRVEDICDQFGVSRDTARRDLVKLEEQKAIVRTHGGAILSTLTKDVGFYDERARTGTADKRAIGLAAARLVKDGDHLFLTASTTVQAAAECMRTADNVVVTNSIDIAGILAHHQTMTIQLLAGQLHQRQRFLYGARTLATLADYRVDKLLLGIGAIGVDGLMCPYEEEGHMLRLMLRQADRIIVLADHTKFGKRQFFKVAALRDIDVLVTDREPGRDLSAALSDAEVEVVLAPASSHAQGEE